MSAPTLVRRVEHALGKRAVFWERPECGLSAAHRFSVTFGDGDAVFVKEATDDETARQLNTEHDMLRAVGSRFAPEIRHWAPGRLPMLITEHLPDYWPAGTGVVRWRAGDIDAVHGTLTELRALPPSSDLPSAPWPDPTWAHLADDPQLVKSGLCSASWLAAHGHRLIAADGGAVIREEAVVHGDVRSDNLCILPNGRVKFVDWSDSGKGHRLHDLVTFLPVAHLEGGALPISILDHDVEAVIRLTGPTIQRAAHFTDGPDWLGRVLLRIARINLDWISALLAIEPPGEH